jgi:hypothetical protein
MPSNSEFHSAPNFDAMPLRISRFYQDEGRQARSEPGDESAKPGRRQMSRVAYMPGHRPERLWHPPLKSPANCFAFRRGPVEKESASIGAIIRQAFFGFPGPSSICRLNKTIIRGRSNVIHQPLTIDALRPSLQ